MLFKFRKSYEASVLVEIWIVILKIILCSRISDYCVRTQYSDILEHKMYFSLKIQISARTQVPWDFINKKDLVNEWHSFIINGNFFNVSI